MPDVQYSEVETYLEHFGVKGMKWGVRKKRDQGSDSSSPKKKKLTRQEVKAEKRAFYEKKAARLIYEAQRDPTVMLRITRPGDPIPNIVTGQQFLNYAKAGGVFDVRVSDIYAQRQNGQGPYIITNQNEVYRRSDRS